MRRQTKIQITKTPTMPKKAQDFLVDSTLGEKSYDVKTPSNDADRIVLSIEEGAMPAALLKETANREKLKRYKGLFTRIDETLRAMGSPKPRDKATFFRLLAIMINAGVPLVRSLDTIADQTMNYKLKKAIFEIARGIEKGGTLSSSMERYPHIFSESHLGMIRSGEASGQFNSILKELAKEVEKAASMGKKIRGALMYPVFIFTIMILVVVAMMVLVVPKIAEVFADTGNQLPLLTRVVISISDFMREKWSWLLGGAVGIIVAFFAARRTPQGRYAIDWAVLRIPLFGPLIKKYILARFSRLLGNLLSSGVPIIEGLLINARGLGNEVYKRRVVLASEDISRGIPLAESLKDTPEFPNMAVQMIAVGEETAQLDNISAKIAEYYEDEVDTTVANLSKIMEPVVLVIIGITVGAIIGAIMMPIIQLSQLGGDL